jgi:ribulose-phosphate 3-epimerase
LSWWQRPRAERGVAVAPSILSADVLRLGDELRAVETAGADLIHLDVMDGHFVDNLTYGPHVARAVARGSALPLDCHLMITDPASYAPRFAAAGGVSVSFHLEVEVDHAGLLRALRAAGVRGGLVINPQTPLTGLVRPLLPLCDLFLVMSVPPGYGGQRFDPAVLSKLATLRQWRQEDGLEFALEIDGGIDPQTAAPARAAGADILVCGSALFRSSDYRTTIASLRGDG